MFLPGWQQVFETVEVRGRAVPFLDSSMTASSLPHWHCWQDWMASRVGTVMGSAAVIYPRSREGDGEAVDGIYCPQRNMSRFL